jgi:hypothetical protein
MLLKKMSELKGMMFLLSDLSIAGINVKYICCNNSGEDKSFHNACRDEGYKIKFEFSGPQTPQQNGMVERKFQTFQGRILAMLNNAGLKNGVRSGIWAECARTVTFLYNITEIKVQEKCSSLFPSSTFCRNHLSSQQSICWEAVSSRTKMKEIKLDGTKSCVY